ncbi:succinate dehydrogenase cytochrome b subunit [Bryobacter aggregatus]|uniref:succinate dehydrogenase cytochrome b subunit n=1 Tax=Bryobacter aggregatus TaxID=360054 RepID=UPI0004E20C4B|nr:succinate dehydrogenase cytochrome b subunit [Bryobacter aggregatus]
MATATAPNTKLQQSLALYQSTIGKKYVVAITGAILFAFTFGHMLGNLQIYLPNPEEALLNYAKLLRTSMEVLWVVRSVLFIAFVLHIVTIAQLYSLNRSARPQAYVKQTPVVSSFASRTMYVSGPILLFFVLYHITHLTLGNTHPNFVEMNPYHNLVYGFRDPLASAFYIIAMGMLGAHLTHGVWSMFQSVGFNHPRYTHYLRIFSTTAAAVIAIGNISIPVFVLLGIIGKDLV